MSCSDVLRVGRERKQGERGCSQDEKKVIERKERERLMLLAANRPGARDGKRKKGG